MQIAMRCIRMLPRSEPEPEPKLTIVLDRKSSKDRCQNSFQHQACVHTTKQECVMWLDHNIDPYIVKVSVLNHQHFELP